MSCSHCNQHAALKTECCGKIYCGPQCLKSNLAQHNLQCISGNGFGKDRPEKEAMELAKNWWKALDTFYVYVKQVDDYATGKQFALAKAVKGKITPEFDSNTDPALKDGYILKIWRSHNQPRAGRMFGYGREREEGPHFKKNAKGTFDRIPIPHQ